jgi:hypothetical protein
LIDKRLRFIAIFGFEIILVFLSGFGIIFGLIGGILLNLNFAFILILLSFLVLLISSSFLNYDYISLKREMKVLYNCTVLYQKTPEYYLIPPRKHLSSINKNNKKSSTVTNDSIKPIPIHCYFKANYYDIQKSQLVSFQCQENALKSGFCSFHDEYYTYGREIELGIALNERINKMVDDGQEVFLIGYKIPFISLTGKKIKNQIYLHDSTIRIADFRDSVFTDKAIGYFVNTSFEEASFENVIFHNQALFNHSQFSRVRERRSFFFRWNSDYNLKNKYSGYANFRNVKFHGQVNFDSTEFSGIAFFDNAEFFNTAIFTRSKFQVDNDKDPLEEALFYGKFLTTGMSISDSKIPSDD